MPLVVIVGEEVSASTIIAVAGERLVRVPAAFVATASRRRYFPTTVVSGE